MKIPQTTARYMTVGEAAKKVGVTVRTLQYYDREGIFRPSAVSEGGRRLYSDKDVVILHQIISFKSLGFSFDEIKRCVGRLESSADVVAMLNRQIAAVKEKMERLSACLSDIEALKDEAVKMETVDFGKYADIIVNLQMDNDTYRLIKYFDDDTLSALRARFDKDSAKRIMEDLNAVLTRAENLQKEGEPPSGRRAAEMAEHFWNVVTDFCGGDLSLLPRMMELTVRGKQDEVWQSKIELVTKYIQPALGAYFESVGRSPFEEEK